MHLANPLRPSSRFLVRGLLLIALGVASLALTQCRMVSDSITGVDGVRLMKAKDCLSLCQQNADSQLKAEDKLNKSNLKQCGSNPGCMTQEQVRHNAAVAAIQAALVACQNDCHHQGSGGVGP